MALIRTLLMLVVFGLTSSCGILFGGGDDAPLPLKGLADCTASEVEAVICGTVYAPDAATPIVGTEIRISPILPKATTKSVGSASKGVANDKECITDNVGKFACAGISESGKFTFVVDGSGINLSFDADVAIGAVADAYGTTTTASNTTTNWLVVQGIYDGIQLLLSQLKGCTLTGNSLSPASLTASEECTTAGLTVIADTKLATIFDSLSNISSYSFIFINAATDMTKYKTVLQEYVAQGGNLYFSDTAAVGLTAAFPDKITFGDNSATTTGTLKEAAVDSSDLDTFLGASLIEVNFDLRNWQPVTSVASGVTTYISGDTSTMGGTVSAPLVVGWKQSGGGCILYSSYHAETITLSVPDQDKALKYLIQNVETMCK